MCRLISFGMAPMLVAILAVSPASASVIPVTILNNSFEAYTNDGSYNRPDDWTLIDPVNNQIQVTGSTVYDGSRSVYSVFAGPMDDRFYQLIDVSAYASQIDVEHVFATFSANAIAIQANLSDVGRMQLRFLDDSLVELSSTAFIGPQNYQVWEELDITDALLPTGTRQIALTFSLYRAGGSGTDARVDGPVTGFLTIVPEPSTFALSAVGFLGLAFFGRRRKRNGVGPPESASHLDRKVPSDA